MARQVMSPLDEFSQHSLARGQVVMIACVVEQVCVKDVEIIVLYTSSFRVSNTPVDSHLTPNEPDDHVDAAHATPFAKRIWGPRWSLRCHKMRRLLSIRQERCIIEAKWESGNNDTLRKT